jgi:hypothetical protein
MIPKPETRDRFEDAHWNVFQDATRGSMIVATVEHAFLKNVLVLSVFYDSPRAEEVHHACNFFLN